MLKFLRTFKSVADTGLSLLELVVKTSELPTSTPTCDPVSLLILPCTT